MSDPKKNLGAPSSDETSALFVSARKKQLAEQEALQKKQEEERRRMEAEAEVRRLEEEVSARKAAAEKEAARLAAEQAAAGKAQAAGATPFGSAPAQGAGPAPAAPQAPAQTPPPAAPVMASAGATQPAPAKSGPKKLLLIGGIAVAAIVVVVLIIALASGGGSGDTPAAGASGAAPAAAATGNMVDAGNTLDASVRVSNVGLTIPYPSASLEIVASGDDYVDFAAASPDEVGNIIFFFTTKSVTDWSDDGLKSAFAPVYTSLVDYKIGVENLNVHDEVFENEADAPIRYHVSGTTVDGNGTPLGVYIRMALSDDQPYAMMVICDESRMPSYEGLAEAMRVGAQYE